MPVIDYPSTLPGPSTTSEPKVRARSSGLPGLEGYTAPERDYYGTLSVSFFFDRSQAAIFKAWWDANSGYWFNAVWPRLSQSLSVYRLLGAPTFNHVSDGAYRVSARVELRGASRVVKMGCTEGPVWSTMFPVSRDRNSVAYGNGRFVSGERVAGNATASWSANGSAWTAATTTLPSNGSIPGLAFGNGIFYSNFNALQCATSTDGDSWISRNHPSFSGPAVPWFGGGTFIQTHGTAATTQMTVDGVVFTSGVTPSVNLSAGGGCFGGGVHVAWGTAGACYSLDNGVTWAAATVPAGWASPASMAYGNGVFVAFGNAGSLSNVYRYSVDGRNWMQGTLPLSAAWTSVIYTDRAFLACSRHLTTNGHLLATSSSGTAWTISLNTFVLAAGFTHLAANDAGVYVALSNVTSTAGEVGAC